MLFFIYLNAFRVEKFEGINLQGHFNGGSSLETWGEKLLKPFGGLKWEPFGFPNLLWTKISYSTH